MGEFDVFKSLLDKETNEFSNPENLGYPVNDVGNDIFFVLSADGQRGYYSSAKENSLGGTDIYQIDTRFGENDLAVRAGIVYVNDRPERTSIKIYENDNPSSATQYYSNAATGKFLLILNPMKSYKAVIESPDCEPLTIDLKPLAHENGTGELQFNLRKKQ
jgi:hypothetical protein